LRRLAPKLVLSVLSVVIVLAIGEVAIRNFTEVDKRLTVRDPVIGKRYVRSFDDDVYVPESGRTIRLRFNRDGFRGPDVPYDTPAGTRRIAVIGDSMTVVVATAEEKTMVADLERRLHAAFPGEHWEVLNFGVSSASTGQELVLYRELVWRYQPDIVVLAFFVGNDLADNSRRLTGARRIYFDLDDDGGVRQLPYSAAASGLSKWLNQHSRFYVWYRIVRTRSRERMRELAGRLPSRFQVFNTAGNSDVDHAWELTRRLLAQFRDEVARRGARFVVAVLPTGPQIYDDLWAEVIDGAGDDARFFDQTYPERRLEGICGELDIPCVTMADAFREAAAGQAAKDESRFFYGNGRAHFTDAGNRLAAEILFDRLEDEVRDLQPRSTSPPATVP
jgi:hypothetical protein